MKALIVYATYSSGTQTASEMVEETLKEIGYEVTRKIVSDTSPDDFGIHDLVVFGSPSWMIGEKDGQPHHLYKELIEITKGKTFEKTLFAVFGLGDSAYAHFCTAVDHLENFVDEMDGKLLQPSLRIDGYYFNQDKNDAAIKDWILHLIQKNPPV